MPLGFDRLNERTQRPNGNINFIKPWEKYPADDQRKAQLFLERIAAQCYPVMKKQYLYVQSLEEFPPNNEFLGRNFNAGECVQLVLKDKAGRWLSFKFVQMVMMHELAHCKQMNHSKLFWQERNTFAKQMEELWAAGYLGEGLWGRGKDLESGDFVGRQMPNDPQIPEHLCGGAYRRIGRKRKRGAEKATLSYAERLQKRIAKKFGTHGDGNALGEDGAFRGFLEKGNRRPGKPTVAQSKRGRELRANAALVRISVLDRTQNQPSRHPGKTGKPGQQLLDFAQGNDEDQWPEWDSDEDLTSDMNDKSRVRIKDEQGHDLIQVCGEENEGDYGGQDEKDELRALQLDNVTHRRTNTEPFETSKPVIKREPSLSGSAASPIPLDDGDDDVLPMIVPTDVDTAPPSEVGLDEPVSTSLKSKAAPQLTPSSTLKVAAQRIPSTIPPPPDASRASAKTNSPLPKPATHQPLSMSHISCSSGNPLPASDALSWTASDALSGYAALFTCPVCSLENASSSFTCMACSNVLKPALIKDKWKCKSETCNATKYTNAGDVGRCGLCGAQKPGRPAASSEFTAGMTAGSILRWD